MRRLWHGWFEMHGLNRGAIIGLILATFIIGMLLAILMYSGLLVTDLFGKAPQLLLTIAYAFLATYAFVVTCTFVRYKRTLSRNRTAPIHKPSRVGVGLLYWFLPKDKREHLPGDLEEEFATVILPTFGLRYAKFWFWWQVVRSILATNKWIGWLAGGGGMGGIATAIGAFLKRRDDD